MPSHRAQIAPRILQHGKKGINRIRWWGIGDEMNRQTPRQVPIGRLMIGKPGKGSKPACLTFRKFLPHQGFRAGFMGGGAEHKAMGRAHRGEGPAGQASGKAGDIGLRIACSRRQRVKFQNLTRKIFIEATWAGLGHPAIRSDGGLVIQIGDHGRVAHRGKQHIREMPCHMWADGFTDEMPSEIGHLAAGDSKMIGPKLDQPFTKRRRAGDGFRQEGIGFNPPEPRLMRATLPLARRFGIFFHHLTDRGQIRKTCLIDWRGGRCRQFRD